MRKFFFLALTLLTTVASAQDSKKTVILYNIVPVDASISSDGDILEIYGQNDTYLRGYQIVKQDRTLPNESVIPEGADINGLYTVVKDNFNLNYEADRATLTRTIIQNLDNAADAVFLNPANKILITTYSSKGLSNRGKVLFDNRLKSILSYLEIKGLSKSQIIISPDQQSDVTDNIIITVIE